MDRVRRVGQPAVRSTEHAFSNKTFQDKSFYPKITTRLVFSGVGKGGKGQVKVNLEEMKITSSRDYTPLGRIGSQKPAKSSRGVFKDPRENQVCVTSA